MGKVNTLEALEMLKKGETQTSVAKHFGVTRQAITPLARRLESQNIELVKSDAGRPKNGNGHDNFEDMVRRDIAAREALLEVPGLKTRIAVLERENAGLRKIIEDWQRTKNAYQQGRINSNFTERILFRTKNLRLSIDITHLPICATNDTCKPAGVFLLCKSNAERKELRLHMASVEERLGDDAEKAVQFAKHFGIPAAKQLYGNGIGHDRFREFIQTRLGPDGIDRPMFNLYGTTGGADPLQFFFYRLSEIIIDEIQKRDNQINFLKEKLDAERAQAESLKKLHNHRDIAPEIVEFTNELAEQVNRFKNSG